uniref:Vacuolar protein sorting-associated protein 13 n=1 Tax=Timema tahoe TaxID=61484 RepID=A0A7R9IDA3_9NEOP|nr:unnamed protein product [Timema tahoe]
MGASGKGTAGASDLNDATRDGDVVLQDLHLKETALEDLDLPVKTVFGHLGKLVLKIPWKNLYSAPVEASIERLYLLAVPNKGLKYDAEKEEKWEQDAKQTELLKVEEAKKIEKDKGEVLMYPERVLNLEGLAVYWNCDTIFHMGTEPSELMKHFQEGICTKDTRPEGYLYMVGPINSTAKLKLNPKPENDGSNFKIPKVQLNLDLETLAIGMSKLQYLGIIEMLDSIEQMTLAAPYRKYRPELLTFRGHYKQCTAWKFAFTCILEEDVRRRHRNWDWNHIARHRQLCRDYAEAYQTKLTARKLPADVQAKLAECERLLDVFNIVLIRQRIEMEVERQDRIALERKQSKSWFGGWFGSGKTQEQEDMTAAAIAKKFEEAMTPDEKSKLYRAIDYQEGVLPTSYPKTFIAINMKFHLGCLGITVRDDSYSDPVVLRLELQDVGTTVQQRPSANALNVLAKVHQFTVYGLKQGEVVPRLVTSKMEPGTSLLDVLFETNPLDETCDQRIHVKAHPLQIVYDAVTINKITDVFKKPETASLHQLQAAAVSTLADFREMSATGLQHAIDQSTIMDLKINLKAPYIVIPRSGFYTKSEDVLVINLGRLNMSSVPRPLKAVKVHELFTLGSTEDDILKTMMTHSYDHFTIELFDIQILIAMSGEDWKTSLTDSQVTSLHLLQPSLLKINLGKCLITDDPRLPKIKITGQLPNVAINISDERLFHLLSLLSSIPMPGDEDSEDDIIAAPDSLSRSSSLSSILAKSKDMPAKIVPSKEALQRKAQNEKDSVQAIEMEIKFEMGDMTLSLYKQHTSILKLEENPTAEDRTDKLLDFHILRLELELVQLTFDMKVSLRLGGIELTYHDFAENVKLLNTPMAAGQAEYLLTVLYVSLVDLNFTTLDILLHQEALVAIMDFGNSFQARLDQLEIKPSKEKILLPLPSAKPTLSTIAEDEDGTVEVEQKKRIRPKKKIVVETIDFKLKARLNDVNINLANRHQKLAGLVVSGVESHVIVKKSYTEVTARLKNLIILDPKPETIHHNILSIVGNEVISLQIVMYNLDNEDENSDNVDMSIDAELGGIRIVFLNWFMNSLMTFLDAFQQAQDAIIVAAAGAAEVAKQNVQDMYAKAVKMTLNVRIKYVGLTLKVKLDDNGIVINECPVLQPISFELLMLRNLSAGWYKSIPDIEMSGRLQAILIKIVASKSTVDMETIVDPAKVETHSVSTFLKFTFTMDSLIIELFTGGSKALLNQESPQRHPEQGLARFNLHVLSLKGRMLSDGSLSTSILLVDCLLDDMRLNKNIQITRLMERKEDVGEIRESPAKGDKCTGETHYRSMVDITYQQKGDDMFVDMRVFGFNLILSMDYLMKIAAFFTSGLESTSPPATEVSVAKQTPQDATSRQSIKSRHSELNRKSRSTIKSTEQVVVVPQSMMTVNIRVERPDIILVENMEDINTNAIILNTEVIFKLRTTGNHMVMNGSIKDLQLYSCCFNPSKRMETMAQILRPCSVSLAGSTPQGEGLHVDVCITDIRLGVSPGTIELLSKVQAALAAGTVEASEAARKEVEYADIWNPKPFNETEMWYLKTELGEEAVMVEPAVEPSPVPTGEICIVAAPSIVITVEAGVGNQTLPMILLELGFQGTVHDWSSQLYVDSSMTLQMAYYNSALALWEPLIEPVEVFKDGRSFHTPWELTAMVQMNSQEPVSTPLSTSTDVEEIPFQPPGLSIEIFSKENLEMTMTKTCLDVLTNLGKAFQTAMTEEGLKARPGPKAPYVVENDTGLSITLKLDDGPFQLQEVEAGDEYKQVVLGIGAKVGLCLRASKEGAMTEKPTIPKDTSTSSLEHQVDEKLLSIRVNERNFDLELPVVRADKRYFDLHHRGEGNDPWGLVSDVKVQDGGTIVTLRSIIQVHNHFHDEVDVYYMTKRGNEVECIGTVEPGSLINLPLFSVYTPTNELFFSVKGTASYYSFGYTVSVVPYIWKDLQNMLTTSKLLQCDPKNKGDKEPFFMKIVGEMEQVYYENTSRHTMSSTCYNIHLRPAVVLKNFLPVDLVCCVQGVPKERGLKAGECMQMPTAEPGKTTIVLRISNYLDKEWSCKHEIQNNAPEFAVWTFDSYDSVQKVSLDLGMHSVFKNGSIVMSLYCPFWMLNKTGLMLSYRKSRRTEKSEAAGSPVKRWSSNLSLVTKSSAGQSDESANILYHPADFKEPVLFSFKAKSFFGKKKASIKIEDGEWSDKFSLDVAGSSGVVDCKSVGMVYQVGVHIQLTYSTLTKQVIFMPYFVLINNGREAVECQETDRISEPWFKVQPGECTPFWPCCTATDKEMRVRMCGTTEMTEPFSYATVHTTLLGLKNKHGGVNVDVQMTEGAVYINFSSYEHGLAPALLVNHTQYSIQLCEKGLPKTITLNPKEQMMFTWEKPTGSRQIIWNAAKKKEFTDDLRKDGIGEFSLTGDDITYWVSFLDGMQRVLLFTPEMAVARDAQSAGELEAIDQEITLSIHGLGLSLINNAICTELLYIGVASSGVIWETRKTNSKRFKPLSVKDCQLIEEAYQRYTSELQMNKQASGQVVIEDSLEVDFVAEEMLRPNKRRLRRTFQTGLWFQMKTSPHQLQLHAKVNRLQIDNQMLDCVFPVILAPVPPPKSVAADTALKPFAELSIVQRVMPYSAVQQFKYFKILIQEFHVKIDIGFINALLEMFEAEETSEVEEVKQFKEDLGLVEKPLLAHVTLQSSQEQKNFYDLLHFSPFKATNVLLQIHLSFSLSGGTSGQKVTQEAPRFLTVLMQSLGVTLTDVHDVVFKLAYFERQYTFLTQGQLISEATMHYVGQGLKQMYVLVLGLDVIGNPYGLVIGFTQGVEDLFYEPFQGAIQGPGEFAEGLVLGVRSLFGHTVGGAAGAVSRITGAVGKGIAALSFDKDYQRKRREAMHQRPANVQMGLARSGKGLVMGVVDGVSGVIMKPISGAREEGVEGFFKGVGKGMMGLVTRPTAGVIDFASGSLDAVKRATEMGDEVTRLRSPRFFQQDGLVRPYVKLESEGNKLLHELDKGRYANTDVYVFHMNIVPGSKDVLMLTDKRVMYIVHNDIFGGWQPCTAKQYKYRLAHGKVARLLYPAGASLLIGGGQSPSTPSCTLDKQFTCSFFMSQYGWKEIDLQFRVRRQAVHLLILHVTIWVEGD